MEHLQILQNKTAKIMLDLSPRSFTATEALKRLKMKPLLDRRFFSMQLHGVFMPVWVIAKKIR